MKNMHSRRRSSMNRLLPALLLLLACGGSQVALPPFYVAVNADHPRDPQARFVTAVGLSGAGAEDGDERAKANVSAQISAQLESETSSFQQYTSKTGDTAEKVTARVSVRSSFDRADLIRIVDRAKQGDTFYSYAALDRSATDRELTAGATGDLASFKSAAETAK